MVAVLHPVLRYATTLFGVVFAVATVLISAHVNPHSASWLAAIYILAVLFVANVRAKPQTRMRRAFSIYIANWWFYLINVWFLHIYVPSSAAGTPEFEQTRTSVIFWARFVCLGAVFIPSSIFYFTLEFSESRSRFLRGMSYLGWAISSFFYATSLAGVFAKGFIWSEQVSVWVPTMDGLYGQFSLFALFYVVAGWMMPLGQLFMRHSRQRKLQLFFYLIGFIPFTVGCLAFFLVSMGINVYPAGGFLFLLHVTIIAYVTIWHRIYDISIVIRRGLAYAFVSLLMGMVFAGILWGMSSIARSFSINSDIPTGVMFLLLSGFLYAPALEYMQKIVNRYFFRASYQRQELMDALMKDAGVSINLEHISRALCGFLDGALKPRRVSLYLNDFSNQRVLYAEYQGGFRLAAWPEGELLPEYLQQALPTHSSAVRIKHKAPVQTDGPAFMSEGDDALLVPIVHGGEQLGSIVLEPKRADEPYSDSDLLLVETATAYCAVGLTNARFVNELEYLKRLTDQTLQRLTAGMMVVNDRADVERHNDAARQLLFGAGAVEGNGHPALNGFPGTLKQLEGSHPELSGAIGTAIGDGIPRVNDPLTIEKPERRFLLMNVSVLGAGRTGTLYLVLIHDITDYKKLEIVSRKREGLAQLGETITAMNHEIGNILQPIRYQVGKLEALNTENETLKHALSVVPDRLTALDNLLSNLKDVARPIELRIRKFDLNKLIEITCRDVKSVPLSNTVALETVVDPSAMRASADGHWLGQVMYNLVRNAVEASAGRPDPRVVIKANMDGIDLVIEVADNGCGMDESTRQRLFELFFSTKGDRGTGVGLTICRKIVDLHGGKIGVVSEPGRGTTFQIRLPQNQTSGSSGQI